MLKRSIIAALIVMAISGLAPNAAPLTLVERELLPPYFGALHRLIAASMRRLRPRPEAEGTALARFTAQRTDRVTAAALDWSSGSDAIDQAVVRALPTVGTQMRPFPEGTIR